MQRIVHALQKAGHEAAVIAPHYPTGGDSNALAGAALGLAGAVAAVKLLG